MKQISIMKLSKSFDFAISDAVLIIYTAPTTSAIKSQYCVLQFAAPTC